MQLPDIENPHALTLPPAGKEILRRMFVGYQRIIIEQELQTGFSQGRIFVVRPFKDHGAELLAVVKMAATPLIEKERHAYQTYIRNRLPNAPDIQAIVYTGDESWAGLRYPLVGGGIFEIQSLGEYLNQQDIDSQQIDFTLNERLLKSLGHLWRANEAQQGFAIQGSYDYVLPVNLTLQPLSSDEIEALDDSPRRLIPNTITQATINLGDAVRLEEFVVTQVELASGQTNVTLNHPQYGINPAHSYRVRVQLDSHKSVSRYEVGKVVKLDGKVVNTRAGHLQMLAQTTVGNTVDLSQEWLSLPLPGKAVSAPNPLRAYPHILSRSLDVRIANAIHGDLNLENILVDTHTGDVNLIDFADARRDYVLHDLLRLETGIITRYLPLVFTEAKLPSATVHTVYRTLHEMILLDKPFAAFGIDSALEKPITTLLAIRQAARRYLFDYDDFTEYYQGLSLYLLGTLKFDNLNQIPKSKAIAFWGSATAIDLGRERLRSTSIPITKPRPKAVEESETSPPEAKPAVKKLPVLWLGLGGIIIILVGALIRLGVWAAGFWPDDTPSNKNLMATVIGLHPQVQRQAAGSDRLARIDFGTSLYQGDTLFTFKDASADIACTNGLLLHLPEQRNMIIECVEDSSVAEVIGRLDINIAEELVSLPQSDLDNISRTIQKASAIDSSQMPRLFMRNSQIADERPDLRWQPIEGVSGYQITITTADGKTWTRETTGTLLAYPVDAPPLATGSFEIEVSTLDDPNTVIDKTESAVVDDTTKTKISEAETNIQILPVDAATKHYLLTQLYIQHKIWPAAIEQLTMLIDMQSTPSPGLWQQLGDIYREVELYPLAEKSYTQALVAAEQIDDLGTQAAAHVGLAHTAIASGDNDGAKTHLDTAITLYRQNTQPTMAEKLVIERQKLE
jgi:hypothetical protein